MYTIRPVFAIEGNSLYEIIHLFVSGWLLTRPEVKDRSCMPATTTHTNIFRLPIGEKKNHVPEPDIKDPLQTTARWSSLHVTDEVFLGAKYIKAGGRKEKNRFVIALKAQITEIAPYARTYFWVTI